MELAEFLRPTFVTIWLGNNEILGAASAGNADVVPFERFRAAFGEIINRILATGAKIAVANVADVPSAARFLSVQDIAGAIGVPPALIQFAAGLGPNDLVLADGLEALGQILLGQARGPLAPQFVLTEDEVTKLRAVTKQYNDFIDQTAKERGFPVVDFNSLLRSYRRDGVVIGNLRLTALPLGGIFSLDLIHPTKTGQGLIANAFITAINSFYKPTRPLDPVNVADIASRDKLIFPTKTEFSGQGLTLEDIQLLTAAFSADLQESQFDWFAFVGTLAKQ
jgi:phospholipase/lecithinase/hemolysin